MTEINMGGRVIPLSYSAFEMIEIQKQIGCTAFQLNDEVFGVQAEEDENDPNQEPKIRVMVANDPERLEKLGKLIMILGNAGLEEKSEEPDLTEKWVLRHMKPALIMGYAIAAMAEIAAGNMMEAKKEENDGPVDEVLEAENAKKQPGS